MKNQHSSTVHLPDVLKENVIQDEKSIENGMPEDEDLTKEGLMNARAIFFLILWYFLVDVHSF